MLELEVNCEFACCTALKIQVIVRFFSDTINKKKNMQRVLKLHSQNSALQFALQSTFHPGISKCFTNRNKQSLKVLSIYRLILDTMKEVWKG